MPKVIASRKDSNLLRKFDLEQKIHFRANFTEYQFRKMQNQLAAMKIQKCFLSINYQNLRFILHLGIINSELVETYRHFLARPFITMAAALILEFNCFRNCYQIQFMMVGLNSMLSIAIIAYFMTCYQTNHQVEDFQINLSLLAWLVNLQYRLPCLIRTQMVAIAVAKVDRRTFLWQVNSNYQSFQSQRLVNH